MTTTLAEIDLRYTWIFFQVGYLFGSLGMFWLLDTYGLSKVEDCFGKLSKGFVGGFNRLFHTKVGGKAADEGTNKAAEHVGEEGKGGVGDVHDSDVNP